MQIPTKENQLDTWFKELNDFITKPEAKQLCKTLLEVYLHSDYADDKQDREKMYYFLMQFENVSNLLD